VLLCKKLAGKERFPDVVDFVLNFDKLKFQGFTTQGLYRFGLFEKQDPEFSKLVREFFDGRGPLDIIVPSGNRKSPEFF